MVTQMQVGLDIENAWMGDCYVGSVFFVIFTFVIALIILQLPIRVFSAPVTISYYGSRKAIVHVVVCYGVHIMASRVFAFTRLLYLYLEGSRPTLFNT